MSDVVRSYSRGGGPSKRKRLFRRSGAGIAKYLFFLLLAGFVWSLWTTRDTHPMVTFIGRERTFETYINNVIDRRHDILKSSVWRLLPADSQGRKLLDALSGELPVPEWLLNNLNAGLCHISGPGFDRMDQVLVVTRMTRIGCLAERIARLLPTVLHDRAGGLNLYHVPDAGVYYAVRGRTFLITPSRTCLIRALTLDGDEALSHEEFEEGIRMAGGADIYCRVMPEAWTLPSRPFDQMAFAMRFEPDSARVMIQAGLSSEFQAQYAALLPVNAAGKLPAPFDATASLSLDLGRPLPEFLEGLSQVLDGPDGKNDGFLQILLAPREEGPLTSIQPLIASVLLSSGSLVRVGWFGMDPHELLPMPLLAATFDADADRMLMLFEEIAEAPAQSEEIDLFPRLDETLMLAYAPFVGGPNMTPTLAKFAEGAILSSSMPLAMELQATPRLVSDFNQEGNLYLVVRPREAAEAVADAAREFALSGLLRGYTPESLEQEIASWMAAAATVRESALLASWSGGNLHLELKISMNQAPAVQEADAS